MSSPYVIYVLVASGDPEGVRIVEKSNWTGRGLVFARTDLAGAAEHDLAMPGVYVLMGGDPDEQFEEQVYVGQGENVGHRLRQHVADGAKDFWTSTVVFTSKDGALNRADILHLECRLLGLADEARRARVANGNRPGAPVLSMTDLAKAEGFLEEMLAVFPVIGVTAFERPVRAASATRVQYALSGPDAQGVGEDRSDGFLVFEGAFARVSETPSLSESFRRMRQRLVDQGVLAGHDGKYRLSRDYLFSSPSTAAMVLLGRNSNGRVDWRDEHGVTLKEHQEREAERVVS